MRDVTTITRVYTAQELKEQFPEAFSRAHDDYVNHLYEWNWWSEEELDSLKKTIEAFDAALSDYELSDESHRSYLRVQVDDYWYDEDDETDPEGDNLKDDRWAVAHVLAPMGYAPDGTVSFPGLCKLTGYYADDYLEAVYTALKGGDTLTEALQGLAAVYAHRVREEFTYQASEESFLKTSDANGWEYTENGRLF